jgi:hypothetical protein
VRLIDRRKPTAADHRQCQPSGLTSPLPVPLGWHAAVWAGDYLAFWRVVSRPVDASAAARTPAAKYRSARSRASLRLWALWHAQALLHGPAGGTDDVTFIEDDYRRLAARRQA